MAWALQATSSAEPSVRVRASAGRRRIAAFAVQPSFNPQTPSGRLHGSSAKATSLLCRYQTHSRKLTMADDERQRPADAIDLDEEVSPQPLHSEQ